ncbi:hypothetical protein BD770DRAFT_394169 [Pilaira anomala]|nr:hypothetical protein BD770DRAFT_394169 [Pilaira anomala]
MTGTMTTMMVMIITGAIHMITMTTVRINEGRISLKINIGVIILLIFLLLLLSLLLLLLLLLFLLLQELLFLLL